MIHIFLAPTAAAAAPLLEQVTPLLTRLGDDVPVLVEPVRPDLDVRASVHFDEAGVHIAVARDATVADVAHEVMHVLLDLEGYPTFGGAPDAGMIASMLLDGEVDRRIVSKGFDATSVTDHDFRRHSRACLREWDDDVLLGAYVVWNSTATRLADLRARWSARVWRQRRQVAELGDAVLTALRGAAAMQTAADATVAMRRAHAILLAAGTPAGELGFAGPEFEELRRTAWPRALCQYSSMAGVG